MPSHFVAVVVLLLGCCVSPLRAEELPAPVYESEIQPLFRQKCGKCHGKKQKKAALDLLTIEGLRNGGETGSLIVPGQLEESLLWDYLSEGAMPPEGEGTPLTDSERDLVKRWIARGVHTTTGSFETVAELDQHDVLPILLTRCAVCHGLRKQEAGLQLHTVEALLKGGKSGPVVIPGQPDKSRLLAKIHAGEMPPPKQLVRYGVRPVEAAELKTLSDWIAQGAPIQEIAPDVADGNPDPLVSEEDRRFWSFQPPHRPELPQVQHKSLVRNPIDRFVLRKLEQRELSFSSEANRRHLIRRVAFDLTGLPPTWEETQKFLLDDSPQAYEAMVDRYLSSPDYGERWGRYWLDLAGYADSEGKRSADPIRPHAWRYRDYVIRSFAENKPYDRFLLEQIAGDELVDYQNASELTPEIQDNLVATGFLRMAPDGTGSDIVNTIVERMEVINDEMQILGSGIMGLTVRCAQCHSHKYDPIPQRDYYRLVAIFKGAYDEHDWLKPTAVPAQSKNDMKGRHLSAITTAERETWEQAKAEIDREIEAAEDSLSTLREKLTAEYQAKQLVQIPKEAREEVRKALATPKQDRDKKQTAILKQYDKKLSIDDKTLQSMSKEFGKLVAQVPKEVKKLKAAIPPEPKIRALWDRGTPSPTYIYRRGEPTNPGDLVGPGIPSVLTSDGTEPFNAVPPWDGASSSGRRLAFAKWLVRENNPLTARVMVNRIWNHHFGKGIVKSLGNFGKTGTPPTHPELLDWLATEFVQSGWDIKQMHRLMMNSSTYRQISEVSEELLTADPANELYSRMQLHRLEAEAVRDSLIFVAGRLDPHRFGEPDDVKIRPDGLVTSLPSEQGWRRSIYVRHRRKEMPTILETFDQPQMIPHCLDRPDSTVASQALHLLNNGMVRELSSSFASRVIAEVGDDPTRQIERAYQLAFSRIPDSDEMRFSTQTLADLTDAWNESRANESDDPATTSEFEALSNYCHILLNSAEFLYID